MKRFPATWSPSLFWRLRVVQPLMRLLLTGVSPEEIARALALGATIGLLPTVGTTTAVCLVLGGAMRLNQVATQMSNYLVTPIQILLILPLLRLGERIWQVEQPLPLTASEVSQRIAEQGLGFTLELGRGVGHALTGWACIALPVFAFTYLASRPGLTWLAQRRSSRAA